MAAIEVGENGGTALRINIADLDRRAMKSSSWRLQHRRIKPTSAHLNSSSESRSHSLERGAKT